MSKVTQADIAQALNLSPTTVGLVVGAVDSPLRKRLSPETIRRVQEKAEEMGYHPNRAAQMMRRGRSNLILLLNMSGQSEIGARAAYELGRLVHEAGFEFQTVEAYWWPGDGKRFVDQVLALRPEGVIIAGSMQTKMDFARLARARVPMVSIGCEVPGIPLIRSDVRAAFRELAGHAINSGWDRLALVLKETSTNWQLLDRLSGFNDALRDAGWAPPAEYHLGAKVPRSKGPCGMVLIDNPRVGRFEPFAGGANVAKWVGESLSAMICTNDHYAFGVMTHYLQNGVCIPEQIKVSGFDNLSLTTQGIAPLTTVAQPVEEICRAGMEVITQRIRGKAFRNEEATFPCEVIWRQSMPGLGTQKAVSTLKEISTNPL